MNSTITLLLLLTFGFTSCRNTEKEIDKLEIAKRYYNVLDRSEHAEISGLLTDSIVTKEDNYEQVFSQKEYVEWLKWDSVFDPTYDILQIEQENGMVKAKVSKLDKRIFFLHEEPIVTSEIIRFEGNKITSIERKSVIFNVAKFLKNRDGLLRWIEKNHPELNGFLNDQTASGGMNYLNAIERYKNEK